MAGDIVRKQATSTTEALKIAEDVLASRYTGASFAFAAGSIFRGQGTYLSDIDLVVVFPTVEVARRESFIESGVPVEAFVHDPGTLAWFVASDVKRGRPSILNMIAEGMVLGLAKEQARSTQQDIVRRLAAGPPPMTVDQLATLRYEITDAIDDLQGERRPGEVLAIAATLYPKLVELSLRSRGFWNGAGKWAPRMLFAADPGLAKRFEEAFREALQTNECEQLIQLANQELARCGGRLFDGDYRVASAACRLE